jgi:PAS domain S-box-containing protein
MTRAWLNEFSQWITASLRRKLLVTLGACLVLSSLCFLVLLVFSYRNRVIEERSAASIEINRLLQVGLETAMLNRDLDGLRGMVERLGRQSNIAGVMILAPNGEVRFATNKSLLGRRFDLNSDELCKGCASPGDGQHTYAAFQDASSHGPVLRSINAVRNTELCTQCHGAVSTNPVNGILVVDYDAASIHNDMVITTLALSGAGLVVLLIAFGGLGVVFNWSVLTPLLGLEQAARHVANDALDHRIAVRGRDEMAAIATAFNTMATRIQAAIGEIKGRERHLQQILDAMPDGVRVIDMNFNVVQANAAFLAQHGHSPEDVIARPCHRSSHARDTPCAPTLVTCPVHELSRHTSPLVCRHRHVRADGTAFHAEVSSARLEVEVGGKTEMFVVEVIRDLSKSMQISQEQRLSEIGLLAAGVAHEIHNPLSSIRLGLDSLKRAVEVGDHDRADNYIGMVEEEIMRCIDVTSRLLKLSMPPRVHTDLIVLNDLVADVVSLLTAEALKTEAAIVVDMATPLRIIGSDSEMRMVVLNLAQNALHAMPDGGQLTITGALADGRVRLTFADTGVGIRADDLLKIFDPFWSRRADQVQGTGLGLSISQEIVRHVGGRISVTSEPGQGSHFIVELPSADAMAEPT